MDDVDVPDINSLNTGEICTGLLIILALASAMNSIGYSISNPSVAYAATSITLGLAAIALAVLTIGRRISDSK